MRMKLFSSAAARGDLVALEAAVNAWLEETQPHIVSFAQTARGNDLVLTFIYETRVASTQTAAEATAEVPDAFERSLEETTLDPTSDSPLLPEAELPY